MLWFLTSVASYFFSALVAIIDKYLLTGPLPHPRIYAFFIGILGAFVLFLIPFSFFIPDIFIIPDTGEIILSLFAGALFIYALYWFFKGLHQFEASRIVPAIGALTPLFVFSFTFLKEEEIFGPQAKLAFTFLILGTVIFSLKKEKGINFNSLKISIIAAFLFALHFFLAKIIYLNQPFVSGFIWLRMGGAILAVLFLFSKQTRELLSFKKIKKPQKILGLFLLGQSLGVFSAVLQNLAVALVSTTFLAFVMALEGTKYIFVLIIAFFLSFKFPKILKEEFSKELIFQKSFATLLVCVGITLLFI